MKDKEKSCNNCGYLAKHYAKNIYGSYYSVLHCEHCTNPNNRQRTRKKLPVTDCPYWEEKNIIVQTRRQHIIKTIESMHEQLNEIAQILKDDEEWRKE